MPLVDVRDHGGGGTTGFQALAVVFGDVDAASRSLPLFRRSFVEFSDLDAPREDIGSPGLGDESTAGIRWAPARPARVSGLPSPEVYIWRLRNVAVVLQGTVVPGASEDDIVEVGRKLTTEAAKW